MKKHFKLLIILFYFLNLTLDSYSQGVVITEDANPTINPFAMLQVDSDSKGVLIPRVSTENRLAISNVPGLLVYDTDVGSFYLFNNNGWIDLSSSADIWSQNASNVYLSNTTKNVGIGTSTPASNFVIKGVSTNSPDDVLFEVQDNTGNPVFRVTSSGVRIYIKDKTLTKAKSGGFAVGQYGSLKADGDEFFVVTPFKTRINTLPESGKAIAGGFAVGQYASLKGGPITPTFYTTVDSTRVFIKKTTKAKSGGFAVGQYGSLKDKSIGDDFLLVTTDSTRVFSLPDAKGVAGGFAVGQYASLKGGATTPTFYTAIDSTRVYVPDGGNAGNIGGFAVTGDSAGVTKDYLNVTGNTNVETIDNKDLVMWYPLKSAFLGGEIHVGSVDSVGQNSVALGYRSIAMGNQSQAFGYKSLAYGEYSTAMGFEAEANTNSLAIGYSAKATGNDAFALGEASAEGNYSYSLGSPGILSGGSPTERPKATGRYAYSFGSGTVSSGDGAFSIGVQDTSSGDYSFTMGYVSNATNRGSIAIGSNLLSSGFYSFASGDNCTASGSRSVAMGYGNAASGYASFAVGRNNTASGGYSSVFGRNNTTGGLYSAVFGEGNSTTGNYSTSMGNNTTAQCFATLVIGYNNIVTGSTNSWVSTDPLLVAGNGYPTTASNAMTLYKNGNMTIAGTLTQNSDSRLKKNIHPISDVLLTIKNIKPVYFEFKNKDIHPDGRQIGFTAQNIQEYYPELVREGETGILSVNYSGMTVVLLQAINEQQEIIEQQQDENRKLKEQIDEINKKLNVLLEK